MRNPIPIAGIWIVTLLVIPASIQFKESNPAIGAVGFVLAIMACGALAHRKKKQPEHPDALPSETENIEEPNEIHKRNFY